MPRKGRRRPDSFTLIVVPHTEEPSFSVRVPFWIIHTSIAMGLIGLAALAFFVVDYHVASSQLAELRRGGQIEIVRQTDLRNTIVAERQKEDQLHTIIGDQAASATSQEQQRLEDLARYNEEVNSLYTQLTDQLTDLEQFKADIRRIIGLETVSPSAIPAPQTGSASGSQPSIGPLEPLSSDRVAANLSSRGGTRSPDADAALQATADLLANVVPQERADLESLRLEVSDRVAKVDGQWATTEQLSKQLSLYDASPRAWPASGTIQARFGYDARRIDLGAQPFHKGVDIGAPVGAPVRAPQDAVVTSVGWNGSYGLTLEMRHSLGWSTLYAHLSSIPVKVGEKVKAGQVVAYIGLTGLTTGPHLHYEIHLNETPVDPLKYLGK